MKCFVVSLVAGVLGAGLACFAQVAGTGPSTAAGTASAPASSTAPAATTVAVGEGRSVYGGFTAMVGKKTGFFHTEKMGGRWMLVDPSGAGYLSIGMTGANLYGSGRRGGTPTAEFTAMQTLLKGKYATAAEWGAAQSTRLRGWGFTSLMADAMGQERVMPYGVIVGVVGGQRDTTFKDVFSKAFEERAVAAIQRQCAPKKDDPNLIGYFTGNELFWQANWYGGMLDGYLELPGNVAESGAAGAVAASEYLKKRYGGSVAEFNAAWDVSVADFAAIPGGKVKVGPKHDRLKVAADREEFLYLVAERFYGFLYKEIKKVDPNHLVMGSRFLTGDVPLSVARGMKGNVDVISFNSYTLHGWPNKLFEDFSRIAEAPILISEYGYSAKDSGLPMDHTGAIPRVVETQQDRADEYEWYASHLVSCPYLVGTSWWWYADGFGGKDVGNFGFIDWKDEPYKVLTERAAAVNWNIYKRVAAGGEKFVGVPVTEYTIGRTGKLEMDGKPEKYGKFDIHVDQANRYEGFDFVKSGFMADATVRHDGEFVYVAVKVTDAKVQWYTAEEMEKEKPGMWELDSVEVWLGHHHGVLHMHGGKAAFTFAEGAFEGLVLAGSATKEGYFVEMAVPKKELVDVIREDGTIRFAVGANDGQARERFRQIIWPRGYEWAYLETFAVGKME